MSEEQLNAFLEKVKSDTELQEKIKASDADSALAIALQPGFVITAEDISLMQSGPIELSDEELEAAAGGVNCPSVEWWCE